MEKDLAFGIMRSHFHHGYPKGVHCCAQCTLAVIPVLEAGAIRYFDCRELSSASGASFGNVSGGLPNQPTHESCAGHWVTRRSESLANHRLHLTAAMGFSSFGNRPPLVSRNR